MSVLSATGVGVRSRRRWLFRDLDLRIDPGEIVAVVGPPGSGRTTLLLALADRFRLSAGRLRIDGVAALGHVATVHEPEQQLTVAEHVRERMLLLSRGRSGGSTPAPDLYGLDPARPGWQLSPYQKQLLGLALARLSGPRLIVLDGLDDGLDRTEQTALWQVLGEIAATGVAVIVTARSVEPDVACTVVRLGDQPSSAPARPDVVGAERVGVPGTPAEADATEESASDEANR